MFKGQRHSRILRAAMAISAAAAAGVPVLAPPILPAQQPLLSTPAPKSRHHGHDAPKDQPSAEAALTLPVTPLGFAPPAPFYLGGRVAQASLDFLDEDHILFTFRVPGLIPRETLASGQSAEKVRHIRAFVLALPSGQVTAEALWTLHDLSPYLWMLKDGKFLLRDWNTVQMGDASLHLDAFLRFPGPVTAIELDPTQHLLIANTAEPVAPAVNLASNAGPDASALAAAGQAGPSGQAVHASGGMTNPIALDDPSPKPARQNLVRILSMDTRTVQLFSHVTAPVHLPVDRDGYFEPLRGRGLNWMITHQDFHSGSSNLMQVESACMPNLDTVAPGVLLVSVCLPSGARKLIALPTTPGSLKKPIWEQVQPANRVWPRMVTAPGTGNGTGVYRIARSTLETAHPVDAMSPLDAEDIRGQTVQVLDLADGRVRLAVPATPVLDGGGNMALSPSGQRFAVLHAGVIEVFDLPPAPPLPEASAPGLVNGTGNGQGNGQGNGTGIEAGVGAGNGSGEGSGKGSANRQGNGSASAPQSNRGPAAPAASQPQHMGSL
jgi:hypothetical protein